MSARELRRGHAGGGAAIAAFGAGLPRAAPAPGSARASARRAAADEPCVPLTRPADDLVPLTKPAASSDEEEEEVEEEEEDASPPLPPCSSRPAFARLPLLDPAAHRGVILAADAPVDWASFEPLTRPRSAAPSLAAAGTAATVADAVAAAAAEGSGSAMFDGVPVAMWEGAGGGGGGSAAARSPVRSPRPRPPLAAPEPRARPRKAAKPTRLEASGSEGSDDGASESEGDG